MPYSLGPGYGNGRQIKIMYDPVIHCMVIWYTSGRVNRTDKSPIITGFIRGHAADVLKIN
jgi:hypothetical protein